MTQQEQIDDLKAAVFGLRAWNIVTAAIVAYLWWCVSLLAKG